VDGYRVYRSNQSGAGYQSITPSPVAGTAFTDAGVQSGQTYFYVVTAVDGQGVESVFSNEITAVIPIP
jgi:fibronectin type 3 domain-containing protein